MFYVFLSIHSMSQLKVDKLKLIELCGTSESEFATVRIIEISFLQTCNWYYWFSNLYILVFFLLQVSTSMNDLCFDVFGISKEKKDSKAVKGHRGKFLFQELGCCAELLLCHIVIIHCLFFF